jgi:hypothetical protein
LALSCEAGGTAETVSVIASAEDRARLASIVGDHSRPLKHVQRAKIVIYSADRLPALEVARRSEVSRPAVWRWRRHYAHAGVERLLREGSRKPGKPPVPLSTEPLRVCRRLQLLRGWSHGQAAETEVFT